jgi:SHS family lactate transporter-like MFS transporter
MAPYFIRNLIPRRDARDARDANRRPILEVLRTVTWVQWAQFISGCVPFPLVVRLGRKS